MLPVHYKILSDLSMEKYTKFKNFFQVIYVKFNYFLLDWCLF